MESLKDNEVHNLATYKLIYMMCKQLFQAQMQGFYVYLLVICFEICNEIIINGKIVDIKSLLKNQ